MWLEVSDGGAREKPHARASFDRGWQREALSKIGSDRMNADTRDVAFQACRLVHQKFRADRTDGDPVWVRERGAAHFAPFDASAEEALREAFEAAGRAAWTWH